MQDPTFKDFTYFCEDPDALVEVNDLVSELRPPPPPPTETDDDDDDDESEKDANPNDHPGTPLTSFVEHGVLHAQVSEEDFRLEMKKLESTMAESFERVEVTISRERPANLQSKSSSQSVEGAATPTSEQGEEEPASLNTTATTSSVSMTTHSEHSRSQNSRQDSSDSSSTDGPLTMD